MRRRAVLPVLLAAAVAAGSAQAAPAPLIEDPAGDYPVGPADIVSGDITTTKKGKGSLLITLTLNEAVGETPYSYWVSFTAGDCSFSAVVYNHPFDAAFTKSGVGCQVAGETSLPEGSYKVNGETITWTVPLSGALKKGVTLLDITAGTAPTGMVSGGAIETLGDAATTDKTYKIGS